jgi:mxaJ protein
VVRLVLLSLIALLSSVQGWAGDGGTTHIKALRVCSDPNNLPFSNRQRQGFENRLAELIAEKLGAEKVTYTWWAQRRGFVRETLDAGKCDVIMGTPTETELALTTDPYYRSTYALVYPKTADYELHSLSDPKLKRLKIGMHFVGDDYSNLPPGQVLADRGIVRNVVGYSIYGDYRQSNPPARLIEAVAKGDIDVAIAWGPIAGYFAERQPVALKVVPLPTPAGAIQSFQYPISLGVREDDEALRDKLNEILKRIQANIDALLRKYSVPLAKGSLQQANLR